jgi:hypothetical protein
METSSRRNALRQGLLALGGLVGLGGAARAAGPRGARLVLYALDLDAGVGRARGARSASSARLLDAPDGSPVGEIHVSSVALTGPGTGSADAGAMEWHTFRLAGGTIVGGGTAGSQRGEFAILGGTGRFANARGTYSLRRDPGSAVEFDLRFVG